MASPISIKIDGQEFSDWLSAEFSFSLDDGASTFQMTVSERWQGGFFDQWRRWQISAGSAVQVLINGNVVLTGYVDVHEPSLSATDHTVSIGGRSKTGDLVDCSVVSSDGYAWVGKTAAEIATDICLPFGIAVTSEVDLPTVPRFQVEVGTTAWDAIQQVAEKAGALIVPLKEGGLHFARTSTDALPFELSCPQGITVRHDHTVRFSDWIVTGQKHGYDGDAIASAQTSGEVQDAAITRYRPVIVQADGETEGVTALTSAEWRKSRSIGESLSATITLPTFENPDGDIWWPNQLVRVRSDPVGIDRELLISSVRYFFDGSSGTSCTLEMKHPAAYTPAPRPAPIRRRAVRSVSDKAGVDHFAAVDEIQTETVVSTKYTNIFKGVLDE